jgi:hypothetical protein
MADELPALEDLNLTELLAILRSQTRMVLKRSVSRERLIQLIEEGGQPLPEELSGTNETRRILQTFLEKNWSVVVSQIPCKGENAGKCTIYPCPEGRHLDCYTSNKEHIRVHERLPDER